MKNASGCSLPLAPGVRLVLCFAGAQSVRSIAALALSFANVVTVWLLLLVGRRLTVWVDG